MKENIIKALHDAEFLLEDLRSAYGKASDLEGIVVYDLLKSAAKIKNKLVQLNRALEIKKCI